MISDKLTEDMKRAMKSGDKFTLGVIRMLRAELKNGAIAAQRELAETDEAKIVAAYAKKRKDAREQCLSSGRSDLAEKEQKEYDIVVSYLPPQLEGPELEKIVKEKVEETGAQGMADFGKVMKSVMEAVAGRAEGAEVRAAVKKVLGQ